eukprot:250879_1
MALSANSILVEDALSDLGLVPPVMGKGANHAEVYMRYVSCRMLGLSREQHAAKSIQHWWRKVFSSKRATIIQRAFRRFRNRKRRYSDRLSGSPFWQRQRTEAYSEESSHIRPVKLAESEFNSSQITNVQNSEDESLSGEIPDDWRLAINEISPTKWASTEENGHNYRAKMELGISFGTMSSIKSGEPSFDESNSQVSLENMKVDVASSETEKDSSPKKHDVARQSFPTSPLGYISSPQIQCITPRIHTTSPQRNGSSPQYSVSSPQKYVESHQKHVILSPLRYASSPQIQIITPQRHATTPQEHAYSPQKHVVSPQREVLSHLGFSSSPHMQIITPQKLVTSLQDHDIVSSPQKHVVSPQKHVLTPPRFADSPQMSIITLQRHVPSLTDLVATPKGQTISSPLRQITTLPADMTTSQLDQTNSQGHQISPETLSQNSHNSTTNSVAEMWNLPLDIPKSSRPIMSSPDIRKSQFEKNVFSRELMSPHRSMNSTSQPVSESNSTGEPDIIRSQNLSPILHVESTQLHSETIAGSSGDLVNDQPLSNMSVGSHRSEPVVASANISDPLNLTQQSKKDIRFLSERKHHSGEETPRKTCNNTLSSPNSDEEVFSRLCKSPLVPGITLTQHSDGKFGLISEKSNNNMITAPLEMSPTQSNSISPELMDLSHDNIVETKSHQTDIIPLITDDTPAHRPSPDKHIANESPDRISLASLSSFSATKRPDTQASSVHGCVDTTGSRHESPSQFSMISTPNP